MHTLTIRAIGKESGVVLPRKLLADLGLKAGDTLHATPTPDGGLHLTARGEAFARQLALATAVMEQDDALLRALAGRADPAVDGVTADLDPGLEQFIPTDDGA